MHTLLVTGATSFLGYHVVKRLNASGVRPRVLERRRRQYRDTRFARRRTRCRPSRRCRRRCARHAPASITCCTSRSRSASAAATRSLDEMRRVNVDGTAELLRVRRRRRRPRAPWSSAARWPSASTANLRRSTSAPTGPSTPSIFPTRRSAARRRSPRWPRRRPGFDVVSVCPAFTFGPDDPVGAPANKLLERLVSGKLPVSLPVGFSCTDVRDFADGMVRAAERGRSGERYLLSGENVTADAAAATSRRYRRRSRAAVQAADVPRARRRRRAGTRQPAARTAGADHARRAADRRALRVVRHVQGAHRARLDATAAGPDARRHHRVAAQAQQLTGLEPGARSLWSSVFGLRSMVLPQAELQIAFASSR